MNQPLDGIRVLDLGTFIAGPFCATVLAEFGAEVIKVEPPGGDGLRRFGTMTECGDTLMWLNESRNKKCVTLNLAEMEGREILKRLIAKCDIIVENFRPGVLEKWGLDYESMKRINEDIVLVRISAYGQSGPYRNRPGFARVAHAFAGLSYLSGEPDRVPVTPGSTSLADYGSGLYAALGALLALRVRERTGVGQCVDLALYEPLFRMLDELVPVYHQTGFVRRRMGPDTVNAAPHSHYPTRDKEWVAIACTTDPMFARLAQAMGRAELAEPQSFGTAKARIERLQEINGVVADWTSIYDCDELLHRCEEAGVPAAKLLSVADMFKDPQYAARGSIREFPSSRIGPLAVPNVIPHLSQTPGDIKWLGEGIGMHNDEVYGELLGIPIAELERLRSRGIL